MSAPAKLARVRRLLVERFGEPAAPALDDPFQLILWEQVAYLADDAKRRAAFDRLAAEVGLEPETIAHATLRKLATIARAGGSIAVEERARRMQASARLVLEAWDGDLSAVLELPLDKAVRALGKFAMIGKPGAEKILLLAGAQRVLALDSNGLRVLARFGYGQEQERYDKTYASVREAVAPELRAKSWTAARLASLHELLRRLGKEVCRHKTPRCDECPLSKSCAYVARADA